MIGPTLYTKIVVRNRLLGDNTSRGLAEDVLAQLYKFVSTKSFGGDCDEPLTIGRTQQRARCPMAEQMAVKLVASVGTVGACVC